MWRVSERATEAAAVEQSCWLHQDMQARQLIIMSRLPSQQQKGKAGPVQRNAQVTSDAQP